MATGIQTGMRRGSRAGLSLGRGRPAQRWSRIRLLTVPLGLFLVGLALGLGLRPDLERLGEPAPSGLKGARALLSETAGPQQYQLSVSQRPDGSWLVILGLRPASRIRPEAARRLVQAQLDLGEWDSLTLVSLPAAPPRPPLAELAGLASFVLGAGLLMVRWRLPQRLAGQLVAWKQARSAPPPEPRVQPQPRLVLRVPERQLAAARRAVQEFVHQMRTQRGVLVPEASLVASGSWGFCLDGRELVPPDGPARLTALLEERLPLLLSLEEVGRLLDCWGKTHPALIAEVHRRFELTELRRVLRCWLQSGQDLRALDRLLEELLEGRAGQEGSR